MNEGGKCCGTCKWWCPLARSRVMGRCGCDIQLPFWAVWRWKWTNYDRRNKTHAKKHGNNCPCYAPKPQPEDE